MATESKSISVVHVDDEFLELKHVEQELQKGCDGYTFNITSLRSLESYNDFLKTGERPDAVILDVHFVDEQKKGLDFAAKTKSRWPDTAVLIRTTDYSCVQKALKIGCEDFIGKDNFEGEISMRTIRAVERVRSTTQKFRGETPADSKVIGETMQAIENRAPRIVSSSIKAVHIRGESGTGKEVVTEIIERVAGKPFVKVNCAALQENIFDS
ncbi:MAG: sigma 54-interacting transcriptional regulator, partial [Bdellovibrionales bacterium]|nr:sigma 54-interacting transcriptional regulator [Bdellovibrionales bacterium]